MEGLGSLPHLSQGQAECKSGKQAARGDTGTRDTTGEQAGQWPCPERQGAQRKPKLGGQSCLQPVGSGWGSIWPRQGTPGLGGLSPRCPHGLGAGRLAKAILQQRKVEGAVLVPGQDGA